MDLFTLSGKNVLVTGASSGIGRTIAVTASQAGAIMTIVGRNHERLQQTLSMMVPAAHQSIVADVTTKEGLQSLAVGPGYDGVIFNAGVVEYAPVKFLNEEKIKRVFETNFSSTVLLCQHLLKQKFVRRNGSLIFISSISSKLGVPGTALYASSKAAITSFSKVVASEVAGQGIRSNSICPGIIRTPMTEQARLVTSGEQVDEAEKAYPLGYGETTDVSGLCMFLLSDASKWMTGNEIVLDGGLTLT